jgi:hypothetical protein
MAAARSASRGRTRTCKKWIVILLVALLLIPAMQVALVRFRVKGFASRGSPGTKQANVLRLRVAFNEGQWVLHWFLDGSAFAVEAASGQRELCYISSRSVEAHLLRGLHRARRCRRPRKIPEERGWTAFSAHPVKPLFETLPRAYSRFGSSRVRQSLLRGAFCNVNSTRISPSSYLTEGTKAA